MTTEEAKALKAGDLIYRFDGGAVYRFAVVKVRAKWLDGVERVRIWGHKETTNTHEDGYGFESAFELDEARAVAAERARLTEQQRWSCAVCNSYGFVSVRPEDTVLDVFAAVRESHDADGRQCPRSDLKIELLPGLRAKLDELAKSATECK